MDSRQGITYLGSSARESYAGFFFSTPLATNRDTDTGAWEYMAAKTLTTEEGIGISIYITLV